MLVIHKELAYLKEEFLKGMCQAREDGNIM